MRYVLALVIASLCCGVSSAEMVCVAADTVDLRSSPNASTSHVVLQVPRHYPLTILGSNGEYYEAEDYQHRHGWIRKPAVDFAPCVVVNRENVNVRKGPGTGHEVVFQAKGGVTFQVLEESGGWLQVRHETGRLGWIHGELVWGGAQDLRESYRKTERLAQGG